MPPVAVIEKIRAPIEKVFDYIAHLETHPRIADFCREVKIVSEKKSGVGTRFHQVYANGDEHDSEIVVWERPTKIAWRNFEGGSSEPIQMISYYFEQEGDITHVLHTVEHDAYENQALHRDGTERNIRELENLKNILEA
ncbi:MAG: SRPBCC family protein [Nitrospinota bacterium]|jgi:uncharacterized membrane protein|nr:SRPBCC family protein [Nitrospinota bacterium]MDP7371840.1 SRPBCC family protein [Nitrospinota bacterium]MDP7662981.1 SRPBCC family protein [Nitrospinota bacterium]HJP13646.1 SRPBCC family protein [Nitrospinota bacterium]